MSRRKKKTSLLKRLLKIIIWTHVVILGAGGILLVTYKFVNPPTSSLILYRKYFKGVSIKPIKFVPLKNIPYTAKSSLIRLEDPNFKSHHGLDLNAMIEAYKINKRYGKKIAGGSTITQQITRTLFLTPHKNYLRKYIEVMLALEMEVILSKDRILELYLNYVEFGKGVFGIGQGANFHYHRDLSKLSPGEVARLIIILPSPVKYGVNDIGRKRAFIRRNNILFRPEPELVTPSPNIKEIETPGGETDEIDETDDGE